MGYANAFGAAFGVSRETMVRLEAYAFLLSKWNPRINLVAKSTIDDMWSRHMADSAQLTSLAPRTIQTWIDLGSGGGFPGLVVAALLSESNPPARVTLLESDQRKCVFLEAAARAMTIDVNVCCARIEEVKPEKFDVISARALAPLDKLLSYSEGFFAPNTIGLFLKGSRANSELTKARRNWHIDARLHPSQTNEDGHIIEIRELSRAKPAEI